MKVITTCDNPNHEGYQRLKKSLEKFNYDHHCIVHPFSFGHQLKVIKEWVNGYSGVVLYTDAFDTIAFGTQEEVLSKFTGKMFISCEKACYPYPNRAKDYPESQTPWKYVNGGGWIAESDYLKHLFKTHNPGDHDQVWLMETFLKNQSEIKLDNNCEIFQTIAFSLQDEWQKKEDRWLNVGTQTFPVFFHGNGRTEMNWLT